MVDFRGRNYGAGLLDGFLERRMTDDLARVRETRNGADTGEGPWPWIETVSGRKFHFLDPDPSEFDAGDVAHALGMQCRFNGHTRRFYSVAEHCVLMTEWARHNRPDSTARELLTVLHHDDAEAYISDLPRPVKSCFPDYRAAEGVIDHKAALAFGTLWPMPAFVKELDSRILRDERDQALSDSGHEWMNTLSPLGVVLQFWNPARARDQWLRYHERLTEGLDA